MRHIEALVEQQLMNLSQFWSLELTSGTATQLTEVSSLFCTSIDNEFLFQRVNTFFSEIFAADNTNIKHHVMTDDILHSLESLCEDIEHLVEVFAHVKSMFSADAMHHAGVDRNDESLRLNNMILSLDKITFLVVYLPCQLHHTRPVLEISQGRILI